MTNLARIEISGQEPKADATLHIDLDGDWVHIRQGDNVIIFPKHMTEDVQRALRSIRWPFVQ